MMKNILQLFFRSLPFAALVLVVVEFIVSNQLAALGLQVTQLDNSISALQEENEQLQQQVASASSLLTIATRAKQMGMVEPSSYLTVGPEQFPFALNQPR